MDARKLNGDDDKEKAIFVKKEGNLKEKVKIWDILSREENKFSKKGGQNPDVRIIKKRKRENEPEKVQGPRTKNKKKVGEEKTVHILSEPDSHGVKRGRNQTTTTKHEKSMPSMASFPEMKRKQQFKPSFSIICYFRQGLKRTKYISKMTFIVIL